MYIFGHIPFIALPMHELIQKTPFSRSTYRIEKDHLSVRRKGLASHEEFNLKFEFLGFEINKKKTSQKVWALPFLFGFAFLCALSSVMGFTLFNDPTAVILILSAVMFTGIGVYTFYESTDKIYVVGGTYSIDFDAANPSKAAVDNFISTLHAAMRTHHREKWAAVHPYSAKNEQAHTFRWLLDIDAISQSEYDDLMEELRVRDLLS